YDHRVAEAEAEEVRGVDARIEACDDEQAEVREDDRTLVTAGGGEGTITLERGIDAGRVGPIAWGQLEPALPPDTPHCGGRARCELLVAHGVPSPFAWVAQLGAAAVAGEEGSLTSGVSSRLVLGWAGSSASAIRAPAAATPAAT